MNTIISNDLSEYRLYLRRNFYPMISGKIIDSIYRHLQSITILDIQFDDIESKFIIRLRKRKSEFDSTFFYPYIEAILLELFNIEKIDSLVFSDTTLSSETKQKFINIHSQMINNPELIKFLYNAIVLDQVLYISL